MIKKNEKNIYYIYILECENGILYTGITTDYKRRLKEHKGEDGLLKGAKFTKSHKPEKIVALWKTDNRSDASKLETRIKEALGIKTTSWLTYFGLFIVLVVVIVVISRIYITFRDMKRNKINKTFKMGEGK